MPAMLLQQRSNNDLRLKQEQQQQHDQEQHLERSRSHTSFASPGSATTASLLRKSWPATSQNGLTNHRRHHTLPSQKLSEKDQSPKTGKRRRNSFYKIFPDVAGVEEVIKSYHCALVGDILLQGSLYVTPNWFCFCSKLLVKKSIRIPVTSITNISKKNTAKIIPNAIGVSTEKNKYVFGSLMSRDNTYQLMLSIWQHAQESVENGRMLENGADAPGDDAVVSEDGKTYVQSSTDEDHVFSSGSCTDVDEDGETSCSAVGMPLDVSRSSNLDAVHDSSPLSNRKGSGEINDKQLARVCDSHGDEKPKSELSRRVFCCMSVRKMVTRFQSLPCTCLYLSISTVLVLFLLFSAVLLTWKLVHLQTEIETVFNPEIRITASSRLPHDCDDESLLLHQQSFTKIQQIRKALEAQIVLIDQLSQELVTLKESRRVICTVSEGDEKS